MNISKVCHGDIYDDMEVKKEYQVTISIRFATYNNPDDDDDVSRALESEYENLSHRECKLL
jgi:hypothetical protein